MKKKKWNLRVSRVKDETSSNTSIEPRGVDLKTTIPPVRGLRGVGAWYRDSEDGLGTYPPVPYKQLEYHWMTNLRTTFSNEILIFLINVSISLLLIRQFCANFHIPWVSLKFYQFYKMYFFLLQSCEFYKTIELRWI